LTEEGVYSDCSQDLFGPRPALVLRSGIDYLDTWTLKSMSEGELSGEQACLKRRLKIKASFIDMMKLQSLNTA
jgi:hypothetical protein